MPRFLQQLASLNVLSRISDSSNSKLYELGTYLLSNSLLTVFFIGCLHFISKLNDIASEILHVC